VFPPDSRNFQPDWFTVESGAMDLKRKAVLLLDDTWTTGSRAQSAAFALKRAGAGQVIILTLARHARPEAWAPWKPIIQRAGTQMYDPGRCLYC
jgi:hypothetical protein